MVVEIKVDSIILAYKHVLLCSFYKKKKNRIIIIGFCITTILTIYIINLTIYNHCTLIVPILYLKCQKNDDQITCPYYIVVLAVRWYLYRRRRRLFYEYLLPMYNLYICYWHRKSHFVWEGHRLLFSHIWYSGTLTSDSAKYDKTLGNNHFLIHLICTDCVIDGYLYAMSRR